MKRYKKVIPKLEGKLKRCAVWDEDDSTGPNADGGGNVGEDSRGVAVNVPPKRHRLDSELGAAAPTPS